jgi:hypothetical protein
VAPRVFTTRQVIQIEGLAYGSSFITRAKGAQIIMPQSFCPLNTEEECTLLVRGEETITPQATRASNPQEVPGIHVHQENTQFSTNQLIECQLQMREVTQKLVSTPLFSFQDLKLNIEDIILVLKDTLNTSGLLPIPDPHATRVPSNTLERHSISSCVADDVRNLVISSNMVKLVGSPTFDSTFTYQKGAKNNSLVDLLLSKGVVDSHSFHKVFHSFPKVVPSESISITTGVAIVDNIELAI